MLHIACVDELAIIHGGGRASTDDIRHLDVLQDELVVVRAATPHFHALVFALGHSLSDHDLVEQLLAASVAEIADEQDDRHDKKRYYKTRDKGQLI